MYKHSLCSLIDNLLWLKETTFDFIFVTNNSQQLFDDGPIMPLLCEIVSFSLNVNDYVKEFFVHLAIIINAKSIFKEHKGKCYDSAKWTQIKLLNATFARNTNAKIMKFLTEQRAKH